MLTKDDLTNIQYLFDKGLKPIKKQIAEVQKSQDIGVRYFDRVTTDHEKRITLLEKQTHPTIIN